MKQRIVDGLKAVLVFVGTCMVAGIWSVPALSAPAVFFNDNLGAGRSTFISAVASADASAVVIEFDILNNSTNPSGVTTITAGSETIYVRTTRAGSVALNNQTGNLGNQGFTKWSNVYSGGFAAAEALGYKIEFFTDAALTVPRSMNAIGLHVNDWGTCCTNNNPTPSGGTVNASQVYLKFDATNPLLLGGISSPIGSTEHFIAAINDTNFFSSVTVIANGNGEAFGAGSYLMFSTVPQNSVPAGSSVVSGSGLPTAAKLAFSEQPTGEVAGASISPAVKVQVQDASGNLVTSSAASITLTIGTNPGGGTLSGTATATAVLGEATFSNLSIDKTGIGYTLTAASSGLTGATSSAFNITLGPASVATSTISASPSSITANGTSTSTVTVQLKDASGNNLTTSGGTVALTTSVGTLSAVTNNNNGTYTATLTSSTTAGTATVGGTLGGTAITATATVAFTPGPASVTTSTITASPSSITANGTSTSTVTVQLKDVNGNNLTIGGATVALSTTSGALGSITDNNNGTYTATLTSATTAGTAVISGTLGGSAIADTESVAFVPGPAAKVAFSVQPSDTVVGVAISPAVKVQVQDAFGNVVPSSTASITLAIGTNPGSGTLSGTATVAAVAGEATFSNLSINKSGTGYTLAASSSGLTGATSSAFNTTPGAASVATSLITASPSSITADGVTTSTVTVQLKDANGNNLTTSGGTVALTTSVGTLSAVTNNNNGTYTATLTSATSAGTATITGTVGGMAINNNETVVFTPGAVSLATSIITAAPSSVEAGQTSRITVQLKDANGNNLTNSAGAVVLSLAPGLTGATISEVVDNKDGTYTATVTTKTAGTANITGTLGGNPLPDGESVNVSGQPRLTLSKTSLGTAGAPLSAGMPASYQIQVVNEGTAASSTATMLESIGRGLEVNSVAGNGWTCTYPNGQPLALPAKGPLVAKCAIASSPPSAAVSSAADLSPLGGKATPITVSVTPLPGFLGLKVTTESSIDPTGGNNPPQPGASCAPATACTTNDGEVAAQPIPTVEVAFSATRIPVGGQARLTITIVNKTALELSSLAQSQSLPSGLAFLSDPRALTSCNGTVSASGSALNLSGGRLAAGGSCNFSALVTSNAPSGSKITVTAPVSAIKNAQDKTNDTAANAELTIDSSFAIRKFFKSSQGALGIPVKMTVAIDNTGAAALTDASFVEDLPLAPGRLLIADDPQLENSCSGSVTAAPKSNRLSLSGGRVPAGGCSLSVMVVADEVGDYLVMIPEGGFSGSPNGLRGTLPDGSPLGSAPGASARINVEKPASITGVLTKRVGFGKQIPEVGATVVLKDADGQIIATTTTKPDGSYVFDNLPPTLLGDSSTKYRVEFVALNDGKPALIKGAPKARETMLNGVPDKNGITGVTLLPGEKTPDQNGFLVDPAGVIYDSITRQPVPGTRVTLIGPDGQPVPDSLLDKVAGTANGVPVGSDGLYVLLLTSEAPSGVYRLRVDVPSGYQAATDTTTSKNIVAEPGIYQPALGGGVERIQPQETAPTLSQDTRYYMAVRFVISDRQETSSNGIIQNHIPIDPVTPVVTGALQVTKSGTVRSAELGDSVGYTIRLKNDTNVMQYGVVVKDTLPVGFKYIGGTSTLESQQRRIRNDAELGVADGQRVLTYQIGNVRPGESLTLSYRARVGVGSTRGDGINRAQASSLIGTVSNEARYGIRVDAGVFSNEACVIGSIYRDCNDNGVQDENEPGVPRVRMYFSDGTYVVSDVDGRYSFCGRTPTTQVLKVDPTTLPPGSTLGSTSNRDAGDPDSLFLDLKSGEMHRADFRIASCPNPGRAP